MAAIGVGIVLARETLQVRWRAWIVEHLVDRWLGRQRFYHLNVTGKEPPNPEYRISDDTRLGHRAPGPISASAYCWRSSMRQPSSLSCGRSAASLPLDLGSAGAVTIPAYMVILALAYGFLASGLMLWVGALLVAMSAARTRPRATSASP